MALILISFIFIIIRMYFHYDSSTSMFEFGNAHVQLNTTWVD